MAAPRLITISICVRLNIILNDVLVFAVVLPAQLNLDADLMTPAEQLVRSFC